MLAAAFWREKSMISALSVNGGQSKEENKDLARREAFEKTEETQKGRLLL